MLDSGTINPGVCAMKFQMKDVFRWYSVFYLLLVNFLPVTFHQYLHAQQPAYSILGAQEFSGVQIYDIIQDKNFNYWFATNEGIVHYDYKNFERIDCKDSKGIAFFNFVINSEGTIYCHNLTNQIFEIKEKKCSLFYELKSDEAFQDISVLIDNSDNLVIGAKKVLVVDKNGAILQNYDNEIGYLSPGYKMKNGDIIFYSSSYNSFIVRSEDSIYSLELKQIPNHAVGGIGALLLFQINEEIIGLEKGSSRLLQVDTTGLELSFLQDNPILENKAYSRIYTTREGVWMGGTNFGICFLENLKKPKAEYFQSYFISKVYQDAEGNILLGTFDKGVLVVPDMQIPDVIESFTPDPVTALYADTTLGIVMGTSTGQVLAYKERVWHTIQAPASRNIQGIYGSGSSPFILFDNGGIRAYNKASETTFLIATAALKDAALIAEKVFYIGTNIGVMQVTWKTPKDFEVVPCENLNARVFSIAYDPVHKRLYAATASGLFMLDSLNRVTAVTRNKMYVFPAYLYYNAGKIYATGNGNEILVISGNTVEKLIQVRLNNQSQVFTKLRVYENTLIGSSSNGLLQFDFEGNILRYLHSVFQFPSKRVIDFALDGDFLWVSHLGGVQKLDLKYAQFNRVVPKIRFDRIFVNDEEVAIVQPGNFQSTQRKVEFVVSSPTLRNQNIVRYFYKLEGYDSEWHIQTHEFNLISYNALAPGNYKLLVKAEVEGVFSEPIAYSFRILAPWYARWWFIASMSLLFILLVFLVYKRQLRIQQRKAKYINELNASKLVAIQSQMNPHFIFNSLNSIQDLVLKGDIDNSYTFITKFSNLVRRTLNYSAKDFIEFEQEIKLIELYLSLEKLRFKSTLEYTVEVNSVEDIFIPPMLIQPFIENALLHGLLHKEGLKKLKIRFWLEECLICEIEDNGVGRVRAREIKLRQNSEYESFSGAAIKRRFELLSQHFKGELGFRYEDLYEEGMATGTRVILSIPVKRRF